MKTRPVSNLLPLLALALAGAAGVTAADTRAVATAAEASTSPAGTPNPKGALEKGMSVEAIEKLIGKPTSVTVIKMEGGKAEKWIYRKQVDQKAVEEATDVANEAAFVGNGGPGNNGQGTRVALLYSMKIVTTYQTTALLMINDHLELAKQWKEEQVSYDH